MEGVGVCYIPVISQTAQNNATSVFISAIARICIFEFAKKSINYREYSKLIFTKSIDEIFKNLIKLSNEIKIPRKDLEYISIKNVLNFYSNVDVEKLKKIISIAFCISP